MTKARTYIFKNNHDTLKAYNIIKVSITKHDLESDPSIGRLISSPSHDGVGCELQL